MRNHIGIAAVGVYLPRPRMTAADIALATGGAWTEQAVVEKLGIRQKPVPGNNDGTQEMGARAAIDAVQRAGIAPEDIDLVISVGEEWKEFPLTTSAIYIQQRVGATRAWAFDMQQRCGTTVTALKVAKDMMLADPELNCVLIAGGYRNGDLIDYRDPKVSFMYNLSAGGGALVLVKNLGRNELLGTHVITDGSMARDVGVELGGTTNPVVPENAEEARLSLRVFDEQHMKSRLNEVSMTNWMECIDRAFEKSGLQRSDMTFLNSLHFKRSMFEHFVKELGLSPEQTIYLEDYGHMGQVDQMLVLHLALERGLLADGTVMAMIAAGIGYAWGAHVLRWGPVLD